MEIGDKLLCKNIESNDVYISDYYTKNKYYSIVFINERYHYINIDSDNLTTSFMLNENDPFYIWNFFYTQEDIRKLKLEML